MPVGLAAMTRRRRMSGEVFFPGSMAELPVLPLDGWLGRLGNALRAASPKGPDATLAVVSSGPDDQFYLDHHIYAKEMDAVLAETKDLEVDGEGYLIYRPTGRRVDVIYERVDEDSALCRGAWPARVSHRGQSTRALRPQFGDNRRQGRRRLRPRDGAPLPRRGASHTERQDLVAGGRGGQALRHGPLR